MRDSYFNCLNNYHFTSYSNYLINISNLNSFADYEFAMVNDSIHLLEFIINLYFEVANHFRSYFDSYFIKNSCYLNFEISFDLVTQTKIVNA